MRYQQELLKEPCYVRTMPFGRARICHRLDYLILNRQMSSACFGLGTHAAKIPYPARARFIHGTPSPRRRLRLVEPATLRSAPWEVSVTNIKGFGSRFTYKYYLGMRLFHCEQAGATFILNPNAF